MRKPSMLAGDKFTSKSYGSFTVEKYVDSSEVYVRFDSTGALVKAQASQIRLGRVKDPLVPSVYGVGYIGQGEHVSSKGSAVTKIYSTWIGMISRCYNKKSKSYKFYGGKGVRVHPKWHNFQSFASDCVSALKSLGLDPESHELYIDKDIKGDGTIYSPETFIFVTRQDNNEAARAKSYTFISPNGDSINVYNLTKFCKKNGLHQAAMSAVNLGKRKQHKGWTVAESQYEKLTRKEK